MIKITLANGKSGWVTVAAITAILPAIAGPQSAKSEIWIGTAPIFLQDEIEAIQTAVAAARA